MPIPRTRLIGREAEVATARTALLEDAVPLLTLTGPGGVGKTRLAQTIAMNVAERFIDGVVWVDLAPLADPVLVAATIATALDITPATDSPLADRLALALVRARETLRDPPLIQLHAR
jgi:predicted ATPase